LREIPAGKAQMERITRQLLITGRVQGVGFRFYMERKARELGLTGWVRNCRDGSVEAVIQGASEAVETMIAWARRGPPSAVVADVRVTDASGDFATFEARPTE
jgi:acylphosphatase